MKNALFAVCLAQAKAIVRGYRETMPPGPDFYNGGFGMSNTDSDFWKKGWNRSDKWAELPDSITTGANNALAAVLPRFSKSPESLNFISGLINRDNTALREQPYMDAALDGVTPTNFAGYDNLATQAARNPYTSDFENATADKYKDLVDTTLSRLASGPDVVRGGTARNAVTSGVAANELALNRAEEIRRAQAQDAQLSQQAAQVLAGIESGRRQALLTGQNQAQMQYLGGVAQSLDATKEAGAQEQQGMNIIGLVSKLLGKDSGYTNEVQQGHGSTSSMGFNSGIQCCFVFIEALEGNLPWYVRRARDIFSAEEPSRRVGYVRMSRWLVPLMRRYKVVKELVRFALITPCLKYGAWYFAQDNAKSRWDYYKPVVYGWFNLWSLIGKE